MKIWKQFQALSKITRRLTYAAVTLLVYASFGFLLLPMIVQPIIVDTLSEQLDRNATLTSVKINPFALSIILNDLSVSGKHTEQLFGFEKLLINFQATALFTQHIAFDEITITRPKISVLKRESGEFNFDDLINKMTVNDDAQKENQAKKNSDKESWPIAIDKFRYIEGAVYFEDRNRQQHFKSNLESISISLDDFSTRPGDGNLHHIKAQTLRGTVVDWKGEFSLTPLKSSGHIELLGDLMVVSDYLQDQMRVKIDNGKLDIKTDYQLHFSQDKSLFILNNMLASIRDLDVRRKDNNKLLGWDQLSVDLSELDLFNKKIILSDISADALSVDVLKNKETHTDFSDLFVLQNLSANDESDQKSASDPVSGPESNAEPWDVSIEKISINNSNVVILDESVIPAVKHNIGITLVDVRNLKPFSDEKADLLISLKINKKGQLDIKGQAQPMSKTLDFNLRTSSIALKDYQSYINNSMRAEILQGQLATDLMININAVDDEPVLSVKGDVSVLSIAMRDKKLKETFVSWDKLLVKDLSIEYPAQRFNVKTIDIEKPYLRLVMNSGGETNIQKLMIDKKPANSAAKKSEKNNALQAEIKNIRIHDAKMDFSDNSLKPGFSAGIYSLKGNVSGLSSKQLSKAKVDLKGKVDQYAPVIIKGDINPLTKDKFTEIDMLFKGIELTTFTPYSGKFAGYKIEKGKLSLDLSYKLSENILVAENRVILDQLTLGEATDSEDATSLPVNFALSLLKDSNGVIDFNLPIRGNINDPDFQYAGLVWGALGNLIIGIVSSPFKALANLAGTDGEGLDYIVFSANSTELAAAEKAKLDALAKALLQRPELHIEIRGVTSSLVDHDEMAYLKVRQKLKLKKQLLKVEVKEDDREDIVDYYETLTKLSANDLLPKKHALTSKQQETMIFDKALIVVLNKTEITQAEYLAVAKNRAKNIQQYLIDTGKVPSENVFLLDSNTRLANEFEDVENAKLKLPLSLKAK